MKKITSNIVVGGKSFRNATMLDFDEYKYETDGITLGTNDYYARQAIGLEGGILDFDPIFANNTPAQISAVSAEIEKNGYTSGQVAEIYGWNLGDSIPITLTNDEVIEMQIIGTNHDILSSDHISKAGITFGMKNCLATTYSMNDTYTNAGGYFGSRFVTQDLLTIYNLLPEEWKAVIKLVDKKAANGSSTNYTETITQSCNIFLFAEIEISDTVTNAQDGINEGTTYEYWQGKTAEDRIKYQGETSEQKAMWWLRSCPTFTNTSFCFVMGSGIIDHNMAYYECAVSFGFCI